jgi:CRP-like cAMP-binding protein
MVRVHPSPSSLSPLGNEAQQEHTPSPERTSPWSLIANDNPFTTPPLTPLLSNIQESQDSQLSLEICHSTSINEEEKDEDRSNKLQEVEVTTVLSNATAKKPSASLSINKINKVSNVINFWKLTGPSSATTASSNSITRPSKAPDKAILEAHEVKYLEHVFMKYATVRKSSERRITVHDFEGIVRAYLRKDISNADEISELFQNHIFRNQRKSVHQTTINSDSSSSSSSSSSSAPVSVSSIAGATNAPPTSITFTIFKSIMENAVKAYQGARWKNKEDQSDVELLGEVIVLKANAFKYTRVTYKLERSEFSLSSSRNFSNNSSVNENYAEVVGKLNIRSIGNGENGGGGGTSSMKSDNSDSRSHGDLVPWCGPWTPDSGLKNCWDFGIMLAVIFQSIYIPFVFCFQPPLSTSWMIGDLVFDAFFSIDLLLTFNIMYRHHENQPLIDDRCLIAKNYLKGWFAVDCIGSIPMDLLFQSNQTNALGFVKVLRLPRMLRLMKMLRVFRFQKFLEHHPEISSWLQYSKQANLLRVFQMILIICFLLHWVCCILYAIASSEEWMGVQTCDWRWNETSHNAEMTECAHASYTSRYITSYYSSMLLIQGENVNPTTPRELIFATMMLLLGSVMIASIFGNVSISISNYDESSTLSQGKLKQVNYILNHLDLAGPLRMRAKEYFKKIWSRYRSLDGELGLFLPELNSSLRSELILYSRWPLVNPIPVIRHHCLGIQKELILKFKDEFRMRGDYIVRSGSKPSTEMTVISNGVLEVSEDFMVKKEIQTGDVDEKGNDITKQVERLSQKVQFTLMDGDYFGDIMLFGVKCAAPYNVRAKTDAEICTLSQEDFIAVLKEKNSSDWKEDFHKMKRNALRLQKDNMMYRIYEVLDDNEEEEEEDDDDDDDDDEDASTNDVNSSVFGDGGGENESTTFASGSVEAVCRNNHSINNKRKTFEDVKSQISKVESLFTQLENVLLDDDDYDEGEEEDDEGSVYFGDDDIQYK